MGGYELAQLSTAIELQLPATRGNSLLHAVH